MGLRFAAALFGIIVCALGVAGSAVADPPAARPAVSLVTFAEYTPGARGVTYDAALVPVGSRAAVFSAPEHGGTTVALRVRGLLPDRAYGAHVHQKPCGATGDAAGPHFQHVPDPVQPSVDPQYANPRNEIWLDLTTDANGNGRVSASVDWQFGDRAARSVVLHTEHTHTDPGHAGTAGPRLACVTVDF